MKKICISFIVLFFSFIQIVRSDEANHRKLAEELLELMNVKKQLTQSVEQIKQVQITKINKMPAAEKYKDKIPELQNQITDYLAKELNWDSVKNDFLTPCSDTFTEDELKELIAFYNTPIGKKVLEKFPEMMKKTFTLSQKRVSEVFPKAQQMIKDWIDKQEKAEQKETAVPSSATPVTGTVTPESPAKK